jgi:tRNA 2-thiouridine synthesizing protein A
MYEPDSLLSEMATTRAAGLVVDTKGLLCPAPILKASQAIKQVRVGDTIEVLATDPESKPDTAAWTHMTRNERVSTTATIFI